MSLNLLNGWDGPVVNYATVSAISNMGLKSLIIKYSSTCVKGIDFSFNNGAVVKTGFNDHTSTVKINLNNNQILYAINSFCAVACDFIQFQTLNKLTGTISTFNTGNNQTKLNSFVNLQTFNITSFSVGYENTWYTCMHGNNFSIIYRTIMGK